MLGSISSNPASAPKAKAVKNEFDFNSWLLPTLELEQYEPEIGIEAGKQRARLSAANAD